MKPFVFRIWSKCVVFTKAGRLHRCDGARWLCIFQVDQKTGQPVEAHYLEAQLRGGGDVVVPWDSLDCVTTGEMEEGN